MLSTSSAAASAFPDLPGFRNVELLAARVLDGEMHFVVVASPLPAQQRRQRAGWRKIEWSALGKGGTWAHVSGWEVYRCGHPTANWPYAACHPDGRSLLTPSGRGFRRLAEAQAAAEAAEREGCAS